VVAKQFIFNWSSVLDETGKKKKLRKEDGIQGTGKRKSLLSVRGYGCSVRQGVIRKIHIYGTERGERGKAST
jgi:hypothetical protein